MSHHEDDGHVSIERHLSRRGLLKAGGALGVTVLGGGLLSACGSSGSSGASNATSSGGSGKGIRPGLGREVADALGVTDQDAKLAAGKTWKLGVCLPLTGQGAAYGLTQGSGVKLAAKHIALAGGPQIDYVEKDNKSGDATAGALIGRQLGASKVGAQITSFVGVLGAEVPSIGAYKIMSLDPGGSVGAYTGKPYFWGSRAQPPQDIFAGEFAYLAKAHPEMKRVFLCFPDEGDATTKSYMEAFNAAIKAGGQQIVGTAKSAYGATDYSAAIRKLKAAGQIDVVKLVAYGTDSGYFMKQYAAAGLKTQVLGSELTSDAQKIAGSAYDGMWFASDYFDASSAKNPLAKIFVREYEKRYGKLNPENYYSANYYESTLALWELARRVLAKGGDLNDGTALQNELVANPTVKSVYGGTTSEVGTMTFNTTSHGLKDRACGIFKIQGTTVTPMASFDIGGRDLKIL
jgi:branched-chain amino acid transport system substrate-binding protein